MIPADITTLVTAIHARPARLVFAFAGAGSLALWWLHSVAGSSRTILEAIDCYALSSLTDLLGEPPTSAVSDATARAMARCAYWRAQRLDSSGEPLLGVACSAAIATDRQQRGAHHAFIAVCDRNGETVYHLEMEKGLRDRIGEEEQVSRRVVELILKHSVASVL